MNYVQIPAMRRVSFIKRFARNFESRSTFRSLYYSFIYTRLAYCAIVWRPHFDSQMKILRIVSHEYVWYASYKMGRPMAPTDHRCGDILTFSDILDIKSTSEGIDYTFSFILYSGEVTVLTCWPNLNLDTLKESSDSLNCSLYQSWALKCYYIPLPLD